MGYDPTVCLQNLNSKGLKPACQSLIDPFHCDDVIGVDPYYHQFCATDPTLYYMPIQCNVCYNSKTNNYKYFPSQTIYKECPALGPDWTVTYCFCCCSCLANDTLIAVPGGVAQIYTIERGAEVLAGSVAAGGARTKWSNATVRFSAGTGDNGQQPVMVYIVFGKGGGQELICNMDQPFLLSDGKFTTGGKLRPGQSLVDRDGKPLPIQMVSIGGYQGGVHHIATDVSWTGSPDGHLLIAGGVVAGDFTLQNYFSSLPASMKEPDHETLPLLGTAEYDHRHGRAVSRAHAMFEFVEVGAKSPQVGQRKLGAGLFTTYRVAADNIPYGAQAFLTKDQATDIVANPKGSQAPLSNPIPLALFNTIKAQLAGFFPDIHFWYDTLDVTPNVYAFEAYGLKIVQVSGGLARMQGFNYEGLFMAMAHGVACFVGGDPKNAAGYSAVGQADGYAFGVISRLCWIGNPSISYVMEAMKHWQALFALVDAGHAKGTAGDPLNDPSLACRIQTIQSAAAGGALPECAGGKPLPKIALQKATATSTSAVTLNFSLAVNSETGGDAANYTLTPAVPVTSATLDPYTGFIVHLEAALDPGKSYTITVANLTSILGTGLDPNHVSAPFTAPTS